jgi:hypothetical protein
MVLRINMKGTVRSRRIDLSDGSISNRMLSAHPKCIRAASRASRAIIECVRGIGHGAQRMMTAKLALCVSLTLFSALAFSFLKNKTYEIRAYRLLIAGAIAAKALAIVAIYSFVPDLNAGSDATIYYYPQAQNVLSGQLPYRDFISHYSFFFPLLLAPALRVWQSVGAIVLTMFALETLMILLYLSRWIQADYPNRLRVAFLYSFSAISIYWVDITGYNGPIIALFALTSLIFAHRKKDSLSVVFAVLGFLFSKLLMFLSYPAILLFGRGNRTRKSLSAVVAIACYYAALSAFGIDIFQPIEHEMTRVTSGNIWFLLSPLVPESISGTFLWSYAAILSFSLVCVPMILLYVRSMNGERRNEFDAAMAFIAAMNLAFFILSKKSYTFYMPMAFIFILHTLVFMRADRAGSGRELLPAFFLSATTTFETNLYQPLRDGMTTIEPARMLGLWIVDLITVACYGYLMIVCFKESIRKTDR